MDDSPIDAAHKLGSGVRTQHLVVREKSRDEW
jgi:hypothetical protein